MSLIKKKEGHLLGFGQDAVKSSIDNITLVYVLCNPFENILSKNLDKMCSCGYFFFLPVFRFSLMEVLWSKIMVLFFFSKIKQTCPRTKWIITLSQSSTGVSLYIIITHLRQFGIECYWSFVKRRFMFLQKMISCLLFINSFWVMIR